ncbi:MAG: carbamoyl-phosphate synthase [Solirubrobacterales bacterium]|nr:carbamoyl-phosphate synthase [Solirubrobacterales bacterium]
MNILITSLSRKVPLLKAVREALDASPHDGVVWGADSDPECVGSYFADRFWQMPPLDREGTSRLLLEFCTSEEIALLIPTRDGELPFFAALREQLAAQGTHISLGSPEAIAVCLDKLRFHEHCLREGISTVPTATALDQLDGELFVVKERCGAGARGVAIGVDRAGAGAHGEALAEPIFQPLLAGVEHSIDVYVNRRGEVVDAAPRARIRVHDGESTITETVEHAQLTKTVVQLIGSLELCGHAVVQAFVDGDSVTLLECNPRVGGASTLSFYAGVQSPRWAIREAAGETVEPQVGAYRRGLRLVRYAADRLIDA